MLDGFMRERYRIDPGYAVELNPALERTGVLLEPTSVAAKADRSWLERLISRRDPLDRWSDALQRRPRRRQSSHRPGRLSGALLRTGSGGHIASISPSGVRGQF
jgi:hypothetical protein